MTTLVLKEKDTLPAFVMVLELNGTPLDLTTANSVDFYFREENAAKSTTVCRSMTIDSIRTSGKVTYNWQTGDLNVGKYFAEIMVTYANGKVLTLPSSGYYTFRVTSKL